MAADVNEPFLEALLAMRNRLEQTRSSGILAARSALEEIPRTIFAVGELNAEFSRSIREKIQEERARRLSSDLSVDNSDPPSKRLPAIIGWVAGLTTFLIACSSFDKAPSFGMVGPGADVMGYLVMVLLLPPFVGLIAFAIAWSVISASIVSFVDRRERLERQRREFSAYADAEIARASSTTHYQPSTAVFSALPNWATGKHG